MWVEGGSLGLLLFRAVGLVLVWGRVWVCFTVGVCLGFVSDGVYGWFSSFSDGSVLAKSRFRVVWGCFRVGWGWNRV